MDMAVCTADEKEGAAARPIAVPEEQVLLCYHQLPTAAAVRKHSSTAAVRLCAKKNDQVYMLFFSVVFSCSKREWEVLVVRRRALNDQLLRLLL